VNPDILFSVKKLRFSYSREAAESRDYAVSIDNLQLRCGEFTAFAGGNGAGKTTLLKLLNGLLFPLSGTIFFRGRPIDSDNFASLRNNSVLVHQQPYLFAGSVFANISYGLRIRRYAQKDIRSKVRDKLELVGLAGFEARRAGELSGGERQRVALARALVLEPAVLMLDEPTAHMDPQSIRRFEEVLRALHGQGTAVIMSSHQIEFAYRLADRLERMSDGLVKPWRENILKGSVSRREGGFLYFKTGQKEIRCPDRAGDFTAAVLATDDIILSQRRMDTSVQNQFCGRVRSLEPYDRMVQVEMDCGFALKACITEDSVERLGVRPGRELVAAFKATAVQLY
jgi:tungstate transport system ATP-binding protein